MKRTITYYCGACGRCGVPTVLEPTTDGEATQIACSWCGGIKIRNADPNTVPSPSQPAFTLISGGKS